MTKISDAHEAELLASADEKPARASARVKKTKKSRKDTDIIDINVFFIFVFVIHSNSFQNYFLNTHAL